MRLFFALWPDARVRLELARWARACRAAAGGRPVPSENLHATLAFLGEVDAAELPRLSAAGDGLGAGGFDLVLDRVHYWPHSRIIVAGTSRPPEALLVMAETLAQRLTHQGYDLDRRPFVTHVSLLRESRNFPAGVAMEPLRWTVGEVALLESVRARGGVVYRALHCWTLTI